jgi:hypothetical protein
MTDEHAWNAAVTFPAPSARVEPEGGRRRLLLFLRRTIFANPALLEPAAVRRISAGTVSTSDGRESEGDESGSVTIL